MRYVLWIVLALLLLWLLTGVSQVEPGERAVVKRFGRVLAEKPGPGLHVGLPWGIDRVERVPISKVRNIKVGYEGEGDETSAQTPAGQLLTGDHNLVSIQVVLDYNVADNEQDIVNYVVAGQRTVERLLAWATETALCEWTASKTVDVVLLDGKRLLPPWLKERTQELLGPYTLGVRVQSASVTLLHPPNEVKGAFDDVTQAQTNIRTLTNKAEQDSRSLWNEAEAKVVRIQREAAAYQHEHRLQAATEAHNFETRLDQYRRLGKDNPNYLRILWWEETSRLFARLRAEGRLDLLDHHLGPNGLDITQFPLQQKGK